MQHEINKYIGLMDLIHLASINRYNYNRFKDYVNDKLLQCNFYIIINDLTQLHTLCQNINNHFNNNIYFKMNSNSIKLYDDQISIIIDDRTFSYYSCIEGYNLSIHKDKLNNIKEAISKYNIKYKLHIFKYKNSNIIHIYGLNNGKIRKHITYKK